MTWNGSRLVVIGPITLSRGLAGARKRNDTGLLVGKDEMAFATERHLLRPIQAGGEVERGHLLGELDDNSVGSAALPRLLRAQEQGAGLVANEPRRLFQTVRVTDGYIASPIDPEDATV